MAHYSLFFFDCDTLIVVNTLQSRNDFVGSCDVLVSLHNCNNNVKTTVDIFMSPKLELTLNSLVVVRVLQSG